MKKIIIGIIICVIIVGVGVLVYKNKVENMLEPSNGYVPSQDEQLMLILNDLSQKKDFDSNVDKLKKYFKELKEQGIIKKYEFIEDYYYIQYIDKSGLKKKLQYYHEEDTF